MLENLPNADLTSQLAQQVYLSDLLPLFITNLAQLEFEAKKDVVSLFNSLLRRHIADRLTTVEYLMTKEPTILLLSRSYVNPETALHCGQILRECLKHEQLSRILLQSPSIGPIREPEIWNYFPYIETSTFEVASDAFSTFKILLTLHKHQSTEFLQANYDRFFEQYTKLLTSNNYVWKRQSLKLLGEILLDRINYNVMSVYIQNTENLKLMMNLLRDRSAHIQFEAFHVFKVFVANPHKEQGIKDILTKNQARLLVFLQEFHNDRQGKSLSYIRRPKADHRRRRAIC